MVKEFSLSDKRKQAEGIDKELTRLGFDLTRSRAKEQERKGFVDEMTKELNQSIEAGGLSNKSVTEHSLTHDTKQAISKAAIPDFMIQEAENCAEALAKSVGGDPKMLDQGQKKFISCLITARQFNGKAERWTAVDRQHMHRNPQDLIKALDHTKQALESTMFLEKAKQGVERFKKLYKSGNKDVQSYLTMTVSGAELQAALLGLKAQINGLGDLIPDENHLISSRPELKQPLVKLLREHAVEDSEVIENSSLPGGIAFYDKSGMKKLISQDPELFPGYTPESSIDSRLLKAIGNRKSKEEGLSLSQWEDRNGGLFGILLIDRKAFIKFPQFAQFTRLKRYLNKQGPQPLDVKMDLLSENDKNLLRQFSELERPLSARKDLATALELTYQIAKEHDNFVKAHKEELSDIIKKCFPDIPEDAKRYCIEARGVHLRGFNYIASDPHSKETKDFIKRVNDTFEQSGMNDFLRQVSPYMNDFLDQVSKRGDFA